MAEDFDRYRAKEGRALRLAYTDAIKACDDAGPEIASAARAVLQTLSLLASAGVPVQWLYAVAADEGALRDAVEELVKRSVVSRSDDGREVYLDRLMGQVIRQDDLAEGRAGEATRSAIRVVDCVRTDAGADYTTKRTTFAQLGAHLAALRTQDHSAALRASAEFLAVVRRTARQAIILEDPNTAIALAEYTNDHAQVLGPDHPHTLIFRNNLAIAYRSVGDFGRAIPLFEQTLAASVRVFGPDHRDTMTSRDNLAAAYRQVGDSGRAIPLYEQTLAGSVRVYGPDHRNTLISRNRLAYGYVSAGDFGRAIPLYEQTLADMVRVEGPDHPNTLSARNDLAYAYQSAGDMDRAVPLFEQTLADRVRVLGPDHPNTLGSRDNLAAAWESAGDSGRAIHLYEQTLADHIRVFGPDHPRTQSVRTLLTRCSQERPNEH